MSIITIILLIVGIVFAYYSFKIYKISKQNENDLFMTNESKRIIFSNAEIDDEYTSTGRVYTRGISLVKSGNGKYSLIPQAKVCDIGLY